MKVHVAGFNINDTKPGTFSAPYHGMKVKQGSSSGRPAENRDSDELALIVSLRDDLHRFAGGRVQLLAN
jgi:hypothetical protein